MSSVNDDGQPSLYRLLQLARRQVAVAAQSVNNANGMLEYLHSYVLRQDMAAVPFQATQRGFAQRVEDHLTNETEETDHHGDLDSELGDFVGVGVPSRFEYEERGGQVVGLMDIVLDRMGDIDQESSVTTVQNDAGSPGSDMATDIDHPETVSPLLYGGLDMLILIMSFLHLSDLSNLAMTSVFFRRFVHRYLGSRLDSFLDPLGLEKIPLFSMLHKTKSVISGSFALRCLFPGDGVLNFQPHDLDLYIPCGDVRRIVLRTLATRFGYYIVKRQEAVFYGSKIDEVLWLENSAGGKINVIVSTTACALIPIFSFHSTSVMNFITSTGIFSTYNDLTRSLRYVKNDIRRGRSGHAANVLRKCLQKYHDRGFKEHRKTVHTCGVSWECPRTVRSTSDQACFFFPFAYRPWLSEGEKVYEVFGGGGGVVWCLGGRQCDFSRAEDSELVGDLSEIGDLSEDGDLSEVGDLSNDGDLLDDGDSLDDGDLSDDVPTFAFRCTQKVVRVKIDGI